MSYMDRKNILSEGLIDKLLMKILKLDKKALKNPKVKKAFDNAMKQNKNISKSLDDLLKKQGIKPRQFGK